MVCKIVPVYFIENTDFNWFHADYDTVTVVHFFLFYRQKEYVCGLFFSEFIIG